jgi:hypothetical protein
MSDLIDFVDYKKLRFIVLPSSSPKNEFVEYYNNAYHSWLSVWSSTYKELGLNKTIFSDEFTRHSDINCIFYNKLCVATVHSRIVNIDLPSTLNDSYFRLWTDEDLNALRNHGNQVMVISNMTVNSAWRKSSCKISIKDLIIYLCCKRFEASNSFLLATFTRNSKNIHKLMERFGAQTIRNDIKNHNDEDLVSLFTLPKNLVTEGTDPTIIELGRKLWDEQIIAPKENNDIPSIDKSPFKKIA